MAGAKSPQIGCQFFRSVGRDRAELSAGFKFLDPIFERLTCLVRAAVGLLGSLLKNVSRDMVDPDRGMGSSPVFWLCQTVPAIARQPHIMRPAIHTRLPILPASGWLVPAKAMAVTTMTSNVGSHGHISRR